MSILSWLQHITHSDQASDVLAHPMQFAAGEEDFGGLNMREAIQAHIDWYHRIENVLSGTSHERPEVATVASDHNCALGKWIHGQAQQKFGHLNEFRELKHQHAEFHMLVGKVLNDALNGMTDDPRNLLKQVRYQSGNVQLSLVRLYSTAQESA